MIKPQLKTFLSVCETESFSAAAKQLFMTPGAVLQQINALEKDLGVRLFFRSQSGVTLTEAGRLLRTEAEELVRKSDSIRKELQAVATENHHVCIGTSLFEKCRLLYSLWVLFSQQEPNYEIQMVSIVMGQTIPPKTDLIESVNSGVAWMTDWNFLKVCDVAYGFAIPNDHPLAAEKQISLDNLKGKTVVSLDDGSTDYIQSMLTTLRGAGARVVFPANQSASAIWESSFKKNLLLVPLCWEDVLIDMTVVRCDWPYTVPYGFFFRKYPTPDAERFLEFIRQTYAGENSSEVVPIL